MENDDELNIPVRNGRMALDPHTGRPVNLHEDLDAEFAEWQEEHDYEIRRRMWTTNMTWPAGTAGDHRARYYSTWVSNHDVLQNMHETPHVPCELSIVRTRANTQRLVVTTRNGLVNAYELNVFQVERETWVGERGGLGELQAYDGYVTIIRPDYCSDHYCHEFCYCTAICPNLY